MMMPVEPTLNGKVRAGSLRKTVRLLGALLWAAVIVWGSLAVYFSNLPWPSLRLPLAIAFAVFGIWAVWLKRKRRRPTIVFACLAIGVLVWWMTIQPSHDREWRPEVAVMPRAFVDGDRVRITGFRNFEYHGTAEDFTVRHEEREVSLSHLIGVDFFVSFWMPGPLGHTFVSFIFDNAPPVSISIETRPEVGEGFAPVASLFKQFELIYVVGDERDIVRVRTNYRGENVYLYPVATSPEGARRLFLIYLERINALADQAEFYHLLRNSCTVNIVRYARVAGATGGFNIRHYLNGLFDAYLFDLGGLDTTLPFEELRRRSRINDEALAAGDAADFSARIRTSLPGAREGIRFAIGP